MTADIKVNRTPPWPLFSALALAMVAASTIASPPREDIPYVPYAKIYSTKSNPSASVEPFHYDLYIQPSMEDATFTGLVNISFFANEITNAISINVLALKVYNEKITDSELEASIPIKTRSEDEEAELITYKTKFVLPIDRPLYYVANFSGKLLDTDLGFYRSYYIDSESSKKRWYAETQFQATNARRAFPCFDDPQFRATFVVNIRHHSTLNAFSNTKLADITEPDSQGLVWSRFEHTPRMPTYLVAFAVNDFVSTNGKMKIWARKGVIAKVEEAQKLTPLFVTVLEDWTKQDYALSKLDQIASRGHHGAMENWGLIIYKERVLTDHPNATTLDKISSCLTLAHELAHQWFGNLVTLKSWNTVWLSEGFAKFMEYLVVDEVKSDWNLWGLFPIREMNQAFALDVSVDALPITHNVTTPAEILANFNSLSYSKGACVLRMLQHALGKNTFQRGVQKYLDVMRLGNAVPEDLSEALDYQAQLDHAVSEGIAIEKVVKTWTTQAGFPVVSMTRDRHNRSVSFAQERFHASETEKDPTGSWWIPVSVSTKSSYSNSSTRPSVWLAPGKGGILEDLDEPSWIIANRERTGYFRVNYEEENWEELISQLYSSPSVLSANDIAMLIDDAAALAFAGYIKPDILIRLLSYLPLETRTQPWVAAANVILKRFSPKFGVQRDAGTRIYQAWLRKLVDEAYESLGSTLKIGEAVSIRVLRLSLLQIAREANLDSFISDTLDENEIDSDNEEAHVCSKIKFGPKQAFFEAIALILNSDVEDDLFRMKIVRSLACTEDLEGIRLSFTYSVTDSGFLDTEKTVLWNSALGSANGTDFALDVLKWHHDQIISRYGSGFLASRILSLATYLDNTYHLISLEKYIALYITPAMGISKETERALDIVRKNIKWKVHTDKWLELMESTNIPIPPPPTERPQPEYRLPANLVPVNYDVMLRPNLEDFTFRGNVVLSADVKVETNTIVLHSANLTITSAEVTNAKTGANIPVSLKSDSIRQFLVLSLSEALPPKTKVKISISFGGVLSKDNLGFYRSSYEENGQIKWLAATQFQPTHARRAFPCMDEPGFRATFRLIVVRQKHLKALANMPVSMTYTDMDGYVTDIFEQTPNMATYLVALVVSEFKAIPISNDDPKITVWARPDLTQAIVAEQVSAALIRNMTSTFGATQPVPKYDLVALPDFHIGAMENWGIITFREYLLVNDASVGTAVQQRIALIIAHELAHQWFGNLVTVKWWSTLWQQEGMATFISYLAVDNIQNTSIAKERLVLKEFSRALEADSTELSSPLNFDASTPQEIADRADDITYAKGAVVLNMLYSLMGDHNFSIALSNYIRTNSYGNVDSTHLASALSEVQGDLVDGLTPNELITSWADQAGYPVINVFGNYDNGSLTVTQEGRRMLKHSPVRKVRDQKWAIPIFVSTPGNKGELAAVLRPGDAQKIVEVTLLGHPLVNAYRQVPMRVNYDPRKWLSLSSILESVGSRKVLDPVTRATLLDDALWLARTKRLDYTIALNLILGYQYEDSTPVLESARRSMRHLEAMLRNSAVGVKFSKFVADVIVGVQYSSLGWTSGAEDHDEVRLRRALVASWACSLNIDTCVSSAINDFQAWVSTKRVSKDTLPTAICQGIASNGSEYFSIVLSRLFDTRKEDEEMRAAIINGLGCISTQSEKKRYILDVLTLNGFLPSDVGPAIDSVARNGHLDDVIDVLSINFENISSILGTGRLDSLISVIAEQTVTIQQYDTIKKLFSRKKASLAVKIALKVAEDNVRSCDTLHTIVDAWISGNEKPMTTEKPPPDHTRLPRNIVPKHYHNTIRSQVVNHSLTGRVHSYAGA